LGDRRPLAFDEPLLLLLPLLLPEPVELPEPVLLELGDLDRERRPRFDGILFKPKRFDRIEICPQNYQIPAFH
jgi:hypothetical protein